MLRSMFLMVLVFAALFAALLCRPAGAQHGGAAVVTGPYASGVWVSPMSVAGGVSVEGTVIMSLPAPPGGVAVSLSSSDPAVAGVPASVTVAPGAMLATFAITTSGSVASTTNVVISASAGGVTSSALLVVNPPPASADAVAIQRAEYAGSKGQLRVEATSSDRSATLRAYVTSTGALLGTLKSQGGRHTGQFSLSGDPGSVTVRSSLGGEATRTVTATATSR